MSRHLRARIVVPGLGFLLFAALGSESAQAQFGGPYFNPYAGYPYGVAPAYGATPAPPGWGYAWPSQAAQPRQESNKTAASVSARQPAAEPASFVLEEALPWSAGYGAPVGMGGGRSAAAWPNVPNLFIDPAQVFSHVRLRFDSAFDVNAPDRAEYFYAQSAATGAADAQGPPRAESNFDYHELRGYLEVAASREVSAFIEVPLRFLEFEENPDASGLADINVGAKMILLTNREDYITFQLTAYLPTGDADEGLGTENLSIEPGLLLHEQHSDRTSFYGEVRYWHPFDGSDFAGDILRYGLGAGYDLGYAGCGAERVTAVAEMQGWSVLEGMLLDGNNLAAGPQPAGGDTIMNLNLGLRASVRGGSFAVGWGHALTGDVWYEDILRFEVRQAF